ncbi:hypothetical protein AB6B38_10355 [Glycocaulis abyssi]|uniref:GGDEF domain-containing protein n=1 Tax=Glycocaulis abyssi TaxID=1433403 RepID=A0ABV9NGZ3_9PROT
MSVLSTLASFRPKLKEAAQLETTQLQLINLDVLEAQYKEKWPRVKERIFDTCEQFISKRIGSDDLILRAANGFIVLPGPSRAEEAEAFTRRIETELKAFFLGTDYLAGLELHAETVDIALSDLFGGIQSDPLDAAAQAYEAADVEEALDPDAALQPIPPPRPREPVRLPPFELCFEPVWASATGFAALSLVHPVGRMRGDGPLVRGHALSPSEGGGAMRMELDRAVLMAAGRAWQEAAGESAPGALAVPVHFETLVTVKYRLPYMAAINALDETVRSALMLHILGAEMDAPMGSLTEVCRLARTLTRRIMVEVDPCTIRLDRFNDSRIDIFSMEAPAPEAFARHSASLATFAAKLVRRRIMLAVQACHDPATVAGWLAIGPDYLAGKAVAEERQQPVIPFRFTPGEKLEVVGDAQ